MVRLEKEQIRLLDEGLKGIYDAYKNMVTCLNDVASSQRYNSEGYAINLTDEMRRQMESVILDELSRLERIIRDFRDLLEWLSSSPLKKMRL